MRTHKVLSVISCLFLLSNQSLASAAVPSNLVEPSQVGVAAAVRGDVKIVSSGLGEKTAENGQPIFLGDQVKTEKDGNLQILLLDETIFTIGPNSAVTVDQFVYDASTHDGNLKASVAKGVFRFVTGKIGQKDPEKMQVDLPAGTIGIRGTIVAGEVIGKKSTVVLLGPGENNNTPARIGKFVLTTSSGTQTVSKSGFASTIDGDGAKPSRPFQVSSEQLGKITSSLNAVPPAQAQKQPEKGQEPGVGQSPSQQAGQDKAQARIFIRDARAANKLIQKLDNDSNDASQDINDNVGTLILNGPTSRDQLQQAAQKMGGIQHFQLTSIKLIDASTGLPIGTSNANFYVDIDFGSRQVGGGQSRVDGNVGPTGNFLFSLPHQPFGFGSGNAAFYYNDISNTAGTSTCSGSSCHHGDVAIGIDNFGGQVGSQAHVHVSIESTSGVVTSSASGIAPRLDAPSP